MGLRIGLLFVILATSAIDVFVPIMSTDFTSIFCTYIVFVVLKQLGIRIVLSTAIVHIFTYASPMFGNQ
jgi:zinc transporter 1/2/3